MQTNNYVVGRGSVFFAAFLPGTQTPGPELYFGNTPSFEQTKATTDLKHYSSESGLKVQDDAVTLQSDIGLQFACDNISLPNLGLWWGGNTNATTQAAQSAINENFTAVPDGWYQLGVTANNPMGVGSIGTMTAVAIVQVAASTTLTVATQPAANATITLNDQVITFVPGAPQANQVQIGGNVGGTAQNLKQFLNNPLNNPIGMTATGSGAALTLTADVPGTAGNALTTVSSSGAITLSGATLSGGSAGASEPLVEGVDWIYDLNAGRFSVLSSGGVANDSVVSVTYSILEADIGFVVTNEMDIYGAIRFVADNPVGMNVDYFYPYVKLQSNGNFNLKGDSWQEMTFSGEVLKMPGQQRVYARQRAGEGE